jgi:hypothetical protein
MESVSIRTIRKLAGLWEVPYSPEKNYTSGDRGASQLLAVIVIGQLAHPIDLNNLQRAIGLGEVC